MQEGFELVKQGLVGCWLVKDLSRFGRDYLTVGQYTDIIFPSYDVRFIAINDGVDSNRGDSEGFAAIRNLFNEWYPRDTSKKVRVSLRQRGTSGKHMGKPPYGYRCDPEDKDHWILDEEAAPVVKLIFDLCIDGKGPEQIARILDVQNLQSQLVELQSARQALDDNLASAKSTWESAEEPALDGGAASSVAKYLLIGFLLGGVLACGVVVVKFLLDGMVYSASELNRSTGLPVLGALASDRTKKAGKLDAKLYQMEGRPDGSADAEMLCLMAQTIRSRAPEAKNILVTGDLPADQLEALAAALQATEPLRGQSVTAAESILKAAATVPHVVAADAIVLAADCTVTRTDAVREQNEKIVRLGKQILGCIVYE